MGSKLTVLVYNLAIIENEKKLSNYHICISDLLDYFYVCSEGMICKRVVRTKSLFGWCNTVVISTVIHC